MPMHDGAVRLDWSFDNLIVIFEVDYNDLGVGAFWNGLADADVMVGL